MKRRLRLAGAHLAISAAVLSMFSAVLLLVWYPGVVAALEGVFFILLLLLVVDVCLGPLLTLLVAAPSKSRRELVRDLSVIGACQLVALGFGAYAMFVARPVFIVYNKDRFDIVTTGELVTPIGRSNPDPVLRKVPLNGPRWVHAVPPESLKERGDILFQALDGGADIKHYQHLFRAWPGDATIVRSRMQDLESLLGSQPSKRSEVLAFLQQAGLNTNDVAYVPLLGRQATGVVLLKKTDLSIVAVLSIAPAY